MPSRRWSFVGKIYMAATILVIALMEMGCLAIPTKLPNRFRGTAGVRLEKRDVDFTFITVGATRREEVAAKLAAIDAGSPSQFFWGRWAESSWGMVGAGATGSDLDPVAASPSVIGTSATCSSSLTNKESCRKKSLSTTARHCGINCSPTRGTHLWRQPRSRYG